MPGAPGLKRNNLEVRVSELLPLLYPVVKFVFHGNFKKGIFKKIYTDSVITN